MSWSKICLSQVFIHIDLKSIYIYSTFGVIGFDLDTPSALINWTTPTPRLTETRRNIWKQEVREHMGNTTHKIEFGLGSLNSSVEEICHCKASELK